MANSVRAQRGSSLVGLLVLGAVFVFGTQTSRAQTGKIYRSSSAPPQASAEPAVKDGTVLAPAAGDLDDAALAQARLVSTSCKRIESDAQGEQERLVQEMRAAMRESFESWRSEQPECWRTYDESAELGVSGIGEGGSARGEGVGLGFATA